MSRRGGALRALAVLAIACVPVACDDLPTGGEPPALSLDAQLRQSLGNWGVVPIGPMPPQDPALVALGRALFFDPILSGNRDISCATCHHPAASLADGRSLPIGTGGSGLGPQRTKPTGRVHVPRSAPTLLNSGLGMTYFFWDGRLQRFGGLAEAAAAPRIVLPGAGDPLAAQALLPLLDRHEMRGQPGDVDVFGAPNELAAFADSQHVDIWSAVMDRLLRIPAYRSLFQAAFPTKPAVLLRMEDGARAIAAYQKEAFTRSRSPFDRYLDRDDGALTPEQKRGGLLFFDFQRGRCVSCHTGPLLGGQGFANVGAPQIGPGVGAEAPLDVGRGSLLNNQFYRFAFRVPPLRNVELTAPYMHNGALPTLESVVRHYDDVATSLRAYDPSHLDPETRSQHRGDQATITAILARLDDRVRAPLNLEEREIADLVAFLESLTDPTARDLGHLVPATVPSGLPLFR